MNEQQIADMLKRADAGLRLSMGLDPALANRAIGRANRRTKIRRVGMAVLAVNAVAALVFLPIWLAPTGPADTPEPAYVAAVTSGNGNQLRLELMGLRDQMAMQEEVVRALLTTQASAEIQVVETADPLAEVQAQIDLAARRMVLAADRMERSHGQNDFSQRIYSDVISTFPRSAWAGIARRRIDDTGHLAEPRSSL